MSPWFVLDGTIHASPASQSLQWGGHISFRRGPITWWQASIDVDVSDWESDGSLLQPPAAADPPQQTLSTEGCLFSCVSWEQMRLMAAQSLTKRSSLAGWVQSGERRSREMQRDVAVGRSRRCFTSWLRNCPCPTASAPVWTRRPSWDSPSATCAWEFF